MQMIERYRYAALRIWARVLLRMERFDNALAVFNDMAAMQPQDDYPLASKAFLFTVTKRPQEAMRLLEQLTASHPKVGAHWFNLGFLQEERNRLLFTTCGLDFFFLGWWRFPI